MTSKETLMTLAELNYYENDEDTGRKLGDKYKEEFKTIEEDLNELEQHRKIECELDIDLITFFKALRDGVWVKNSTGQIYYTNVYLQNLILSIGPSKYRFCFATPLNNVLLLFDRINLDWALTKEALEE